jgi:tetratricopeptide (TPR) repeat protein
LAALFVALLAGAAFGPDRVAAAAAEVLALNNRGIEFYEQRLYHQAIESFQKALTLDAKDAEVRANLALAWVGLGLEFLNGGESSSAAKAFQEALQVEDEHYAHFGLGYIHYLDNQDEAARRSLQRALDLDSTFAKPYKILALMDYREGKESEAARLMGRAVELDGEDLEAAQILERWRQQQRVTKTFKKRAAGRFELRHDPAIPVSTLRLVRGVLNRALDSIGDALGVWPRRRLVVTLFREKTFQQATGTAHWIGGLFDGQIKIPVRVGEPSDDKAGESSALATPADRELELTRALVHELTHALIKDLYPACPNWLNEGVAQYFEIYSKGDADDSELHQTQELRQRRHAALVVQLRERAQHRVRLAKIPARLWEHANEDQARWSYLQGLGFVEFLVRRHHLFRLRVFLRAARELGSIQSACQRTYGRSLEELETAWWSTITSSN